MAYAYTGTITAAIIQHSGQRYRALKSKRGANTTYMHYKTKISRGASLSKRTKILTYSTCAAYSYKKR